MVLFCVNPYLSHFIPSIPLANALKKRGMRVIYLGFEDSKDMVEREQFEFRKINSCEPSDFIKLRKKHAFLELAQKYQDLCVEVMKVIDDLNIELIMFHISRFDLFFLPAYKSGVKIVTYNTCSGSIYFNPYIPPNTSSYIPNFRCNLIVLLTWVRRFFRKKINYSMLISRLHYPYTEIRKIARSHGYNWQFCIDGSYLELPHIKFGPKEFEFPTMDNYQYAGLCINHNRELDSADILSKINTDKPLIYCCLGTMSYRYIRTRSFLNAVIDVFRYNTEWQLIISMGKHGSELENIEIPQNVFVADFVPQLSILMKTDIMITHGGYGTIKECISNEVPMIVFPSSYDQHGNAARVCYHKIGVRSNLLKRSLIERITKKNMSNISYRAIEKLIRELLTNDTYKNNIKKMNEDILNSNSIEQCVEFIINQ